MKECSLYRKLGEKVQCLACEHKCFISKGKTGLCKVRKNINGRLMLLVYGRVIAEHIDPIEKKPLYHFLPRSLSYSIGSVGCNFRCKFCQNWEISQTDKIVGVRRSPDEIVENALKNKCKSISYTYNEPSIFIEFVKDTAKLAKEKGLKNIMVTNGFFSKESFDFIKDYIDAMNIDLKSFSEKFYLEQGGRLKPVLENIKRVYEYGIHLELTTLVIPGENDSKEELEKIAKFIASIDENIPWHISRFFPMYKMTDKIPTPLKSLRRAYNIGKKYLNNVYLGNI